jgi:DNA-binding NarL/FixJ family response regulator
MLATLIRFKDKLAILRLFMEETFRLIVLSDDPLARAGLSSLLAALPDTLVVAQGGSDFLTAAIGSELDTTANLIIWDMGWDVSEREDDELLDPGVPLLVLAPDFNAAIVAWRLGCRAILSRQADEEQLVAAVAAVANGLVVLSPSLAEALTKGPVPGEATTSDLTAREMEVLLLLAEGLTNKAIAQRLSISDHTVKFHVNAILNKLDAQSRTDAVVRATRLGLLAL